MKKSLSKRKQFLIRERRLHRIREEKRLARLAVSYNPDKFLSKDYPNINKKFEVTEPSQGKIIISFPRRMNFREDLDPTLEFLNQLRDEMLYGTHSEVFLEHKNLEKITPEVAVILLAEMQRCVEYKSSAKRFRGNYPSNEEVASILIDIGFYSSLNIKAPPKTHRNDNRVFFKIIPGNETDARIANQLVSHFEKVISFDPIARKRLLAALIECMDNVHNHAYRDSKTTPDLLGEWWMAGFIDKDTEQVAFIFFDQGVGVPTTLREKWVIKMKRLAGMNDGELIKEAVLKGITRRQSKRHGNGFPSFKEFINATPNEAGGFLRVISNSGDYSYCKNTKIPPEMLKIPLNGSLLIWSLQTDREIVGPGGRIDLSSEGYQTKLPI